MKKFEYTLYEWISDDESGYCICRFGEFNLNLNYNPESGWRAHPSNKIGDFTTVDELAKLILEDVSAYCNDFYMSDAVREAEWLMYNWKPRD